MRFAQVLWSAITFLAGTIVVVVLLGVVNGGVLYRIDCPQPDGTLARNWHYEWALPIPYLLAPSRTGCETHSATRVVLSKMGVDKLPSSSPGDVAMRTATRPDDAYYATIYAISLDIVSAIKAQDHQRLLTAIANGQSRLDRLTAPTELAEIDLRFRASYAMLSQHMSDAWTARESNAAAVRNLTTDLVSLSDEMNEMQRIAVAHH